MSEQKQRAARLLAIVRRAVDPEKPEFATNQIAGRMTYERVSKGYEDGAEST